MPWTQSNPWKLFVPISAGAVIAKSHHLDGLFLKIAMCQQNVSIWWLFCVSIMNLGILMACFKIAFLTKPLMHSRCHIRNYMILSTKKSSVDAFFDTSPHVTFNVNCCKTHGFQLKCLTQKLTHYTKRHDPRTKEMS